MDLEGEAGVVCWRTDTGEEVGVEGPRNEASRPLIPIADEGGREVVGEVAHCRG